MDLHYHGGMDTLRKARKAAGLTQMALANLAGTSQPQIRRLEMGERQMSKSWAERLAPHLKVSPQYLLFGGHGADEPPIQKMFGDNWKPEKPAPKLEPRPDPNVDVYTSLDTEGYLREIRVVFRKPAR